MSPLGVIFAVVLCFTIVVCNPVPEPVPEAEPLLPLVPLAIGAAKLAGAALAGTVVADAFHAAGGDKIVTAATDWVKGAATTAKDWVGGAWESTKNFFG